MAENDRRSWGAVECLFCPFDGAKYDEAATTCKICGNIRAMVSAPVKQVDFIKGMPAWSSNSFVLEKSSSGNRYKVNVWRKVLYAKQPFPDDYTDTKRFLDCLVQNAKPPRYGYWYLVSLTGRIVQPICIVVIHIAIWRGVDRQPSMISAATLTFIDFALISLYWLGTWWTKKPVDLMDQHPSTDGSMTAFKRITVIIGCLKVLSPLLQTLTQSFSHDTVICLTVGNAS
ncbi:phosphatidylinositol N-acetylglucosaminyltransferase [Gregarina niphandrodes]|uniref:Phosphatidylinositol N-acetylglucosaminyltransferase n=1 Tax=Gregarina niphandrodes TaxID=110365 RepID=A0A023B6C4_GRENI|nr:phosphatidylinositol N-acetylglucosaminyltransferase [Gregarina niphandrodes]EZG65928.1 phosphatidylinositol N-acetylglucosaminyltransferase [Gregarina niphandrodes]|eukprot:XP_011134022.1 phosphatidylinositol N-acetylglucosaminyltransferase [Gregarina niphandrodes]